MNRQLDPAQTGPAAERLEGDLRKRIVGQDEAITQIVNTYQTFLAGMSSSGRPVGSFLFLGPTGSGKTRMVEAAAESLVGAAPYRLEQTERREVSEYGRRWSPYAGLADRNLAHAGLRSRRVRRRSRDGGNRCGSIRPLRSALLLRNRFRLCMPSKTGPAAGH